MNIVVTGADGFIGSHLVELLLAKQHHVRALVQYNSFNHWGWLEGIADNPNLEIVCGDIRDATICQALTRDRDWLFHLAALIAIPYSYRAPASYVETNVQGTLNICQAALDNRLARVIHTSTSEVYGSACYVPIDEGHPLQAQSPYSASKIAADALAMSFYYSFDLPLTIARPFNTYGPRQSARAVIPSIITQAAAGREAIELGDVRPTRDFNYVLDTCAGMLALAQAEAAVGEAVNIGSGREISIADTVSLIGDLMQRSLTVVTDEKRLRPPASEVERLCCDRRKQQALTGFVPTYTLEEGLQQSIAWFTQADNLRHYKTQHYHV